MNYLIQKGIEAFKLPPDIALSKGYLTIPMFGKDGTKAGQQTIDPQGGKKFLAKTNTKGAHYIIAASGERASAMDAKTYIVEGFATGASVHMVTGDQVIVAFSAGNIGEVAKLYPHAIVAADNDKAGLKAAKESGLSYTTPPEEGLDWNDYLIAVGAEETLSAIANNLTVVLPPKPQSDNPFFGQLKFLGYDASSFWFLSKDFLIPKKISAGNFNQQTLCSLLPLKFWEEHFPQFSKKTTSTIDIQRASDVLMRISRAQGAYDNHILYGAGFYHDGKEFFINDGKKIYFPFSKDHKDLFEYIDHQGREFIAEGSFPIPEDAKDFHDQIHTLEQNLQKIAWKDQRSVTLLLGWAFCANICGALSWRAHIWITGGAHSGKSYVKNEILRKLIPANIDCAGKTTEAGLRSLLKSQSKPLLFDEVETTGKFSGERVSQIIELCRSASGDSSSIITKSTPTGESKKFLVRFCAALCSINVGIEFEQDDSRFMILEIERNEQKSKAFMNSGDPYFKNTLDVEFGKDFFNFCIAKMNDFLPIQKKIHEILRKFRNSRYADTRSSVLAGYVVATGMKESQIQGWLEENQFFEPFERQTQINEIACLEHLLSVTFQDGGKLISILNAVKRAEFGKDGWEYWEERLENLGIKKTSKLHIARASSQVTKFFAGTQWEKNWQHALKKLPDSNFSTYWDGKRPQNSVAIDLKNIFPDREPGEIDEE